MKIQPKLKLNYILPPPPRKQPPEVVEQRQRGRKCYTGTEELRMETPSYKHLRIVLKCRTSLNIHFLRVSPADSGERGSTGESKRSRLSEFPDLINSGM